MEKIKPEVIGWVQIGLGGRESRFEFLLDKQRMIEESIRDLDDTWEKSKFRPVYKIDTVNDKAVLSGQCKYSAKG